MDRKKVFGYFDRDNDGYLLDTVQGEETESIGEHELEEEDDSENENDNGDEDVPEDEAATLYVGGRLDSSLPVQFVVVNAQMTSNGQGQGRTCSCRYSA